MKIITCFKLVPEEQDIVVTAQRTLNFDRADAKISQFDLNAIEAATQLAGVAGCVAGYIMAQAGLDVLVIERGNSEGSKNMTGGRLYAHSLESIMPGFAQQAPVERKVTREKISFLTDESAVTMDYHSEQPDIPAKASYTVLRNRFDP